MELNANDVLNIFRRDELRLFVAAASITTGLVAVGFSLIRRRFDRLLSFFAWFATLYGFRLWMQSGMHRLMAHPSVAIARLEMALNLVIVIPAFLFFEAAGRVGRAGRWIVYAVCLIDLCLITAIYLGFPLHSIDRWNSMLVVAGSLAMVILAFGQPTSTRDMVIFRAGLIVFVALVLWTNISELLGHPAHFEFYGFVVLLCSLGWVAALRALDRDRQLNSIQQELEIARRIQLSILPSAPPATKEFSVAARYKPMTSVAGDFYEFLDAGNGAVGLLIADVSGHGVPAALIASMVKVAIQAQRHQQDHPGWLLAGVNEALCGNAQNQFVTAGYVYLDPDRREFRYAAAGHPPLFLLRAGQVLRIEENGLVMALIPSASYSFTTQPLHPGDRILLYTDGILEAANAEEEEFGPDRLVELLIESASSSAEEAADKILGAVSAWSPSQSDDQTLVICDYKAAQP